MMILALQRPIDSTILIRARIFVPMRMASALARHFRLSKSHAIIPLTLMVFCFAVPRLHAGEEVLDRLVGQWDVRIKTLEPEESEITFIETYEWVLDHRFVRGETKHESDGIRRVTWITYDAQSDGYPFWNFDSSGFYSVSPPGTWDEKARALEMQSPPISNVSFNLRIVFPDDRTHRWTFVVKNWTGTLLRSEGVAVRRDDFSPASKPDPDGSKIPSGAPRITGTAEGARIKELTPMALSLLLIIVIVVAPLVTLLLSALLLWRYRQSVIRQMAMCGGGDDTAAGGDRTAVTGRSGDGPVREDPAQALYRQAVRGPWQDALQYSVAGLAFAFVYTIAARFVYPFRLDFPGFLIGMTIYAWPIVPALMLIVPASWRWRLTFVATYFAAFGALILWAGMIADIPATPFESLKLPARSSVSPRGTMMLWLSVNGLPTLAILLCFNRWARPVAPLVLGFVTTAISGILAAYLALFSKRGTNAVVELAVSLDLHPGWLLLGAALIALGVFGAMGWGLARWIAFAYRRGNVNDQSLRLDALWLLFASYNAMWLIFGGLRWTATAPVAFAVYKIALQLARKMSVRTQGAPHDLTFLRVFDLGRRSERLLTHVAHYWRHIGNVQMITGPDVARSTVQPHQFLDFLSGKLATHFVRDAASLERTVADWNRTTALDGWFRIDSFFCHADTWQRLVPLLIQRHNVVLMDLRSFSATHAGCIHELRYLVGSVPIDRCLLVVDDTTDMAFLERILNEAWPVLPPDSPNYNRSPEDVSRHHLSTGITPLRQLVRRLCMAGSEP